METLQRTANRGSVSTGYDIDNSLKFEADNSEYLKWTDISTYATSARKKTFSFSVWFKISELGVQRTIWATAANGYLLLQADGQLKWQQSYGGVVKTLNTNRLFRDTSAWYNVIIAVDSTQSTEANRVRLYVNGVEETSLTSTTYPSQDAEAENVYENHHSLGAYNSSSIFWSGYMANVAFISDAQITPSAVGEVDSDTGIWKPKAYSGGSAPSYFLEFKDSSDLGTATGLDADTLNNIAAADQSTDTPTNNFCTLNPNVNFKYGTNAGGMINGATTFGDDTSGGVGGAFGTFAVTAGKWYWEVKLTQQSSHYIGVSAVDDGDNVLSSTDPHQINSTFNFNINAARIEYIDGGTVTAGSLDAFTDFHSAGDIIGIALNMDDNQISIYGNGTLQSGVANTSLFDAANKMVVPFHGTINDECQYNFGGYSAWTPSSAVNDANGYGTFEYSPPSGYYSLCTKNLSEYGG
tara:strand:+ start:705 stop:2102 length:1398 start_codon:yes stop_codon:yes gene_type:complete